MREFIKASKKYKEIPFSHCHTHYSHGKFPHLATLGAFSTFL